MTQIRTWTALLFGWVCIVGLSAQPLADPLNPDSTQQAMTQLQNLRDRLPTRAENREEQAKQMLELGMWEQLTSLLANTSPLSPTLQLVQAKQSFQTHNYKRAEQEISAILKKQSDWEEAQALRAKLHLQAWELDAAKQIAEQLVEKRNPLGKLLLAERAILTKEYDAAEKYARQVLGRDFRNADAWYWLGEAWFWKRDMATAEKALRTCLELDPWHADARFSYGYAIWRRVDATLLDAMAAQWELALSLNPLHYKTHWHWGNGHTNLTYPDYVDPAEDEIRAALEEAEQAVRENELGKAVEIAEKVQAQYPESVIPHLYRASYLYMHPSPDADEQEKDMRRERALAIFQTMLNMKPHYGPAHNGIAAVIKQKQFDYLTFKDSLDKVVANTVIEDPESFFHVFPNVSYYPGDEMARMIWNQLYTSVVYFPFLAKLDRLFVIPPLHIDLALAMGNSYFRGGTTFDNRQWMDIRGVGSGATGIEYVARGAHLERNVTLHEYVHLFHGSIFTDAEMREVRKRYYYAMEHDQVLDYYGANNEFEYLAQAFPAYFIPVKVHPLNHKAVNTRSDLETKDPEMFAFVERLVQKHEAYLAGDTQAMADNWAEVFRSLAGRARQMGEYDEALALLDSAYSWSPTYLPVFLGYSETLMQQGELDSAEVWLQLAMEQSTTYAPIYRTYARLARKRGENGMSQDKAREDEMAYLEQAAAKETDWDQQAEIASERYFRLASYGRWDEAIEVAEAYALNGPTVSTYLRDRKDEAAAYAAHLRGLSGYTDAIASLQAIVEQKPQRYFHRVQLAEVLLAQEMPAEALQVLWQGQRILQAAGNPSARFQQLIIEGSWMAGQTEAALEMLDSLVRATEAEELYSQDWVHLLYQLGDTSTLFGLEEKLPEGEAAASHAYYGNVCFGERGYAYRFVLFRTFIGKKSL